MQLILWSLAQIHAPTISDEDVPVEIPIDQVFCCDYLQDSTLGSHQTQLKCPIKNQWLAGD